MATLTSCLRCSALYRVAYEERPCLLCQTNSTLWRNLWRKINYVTTDKHLKYRQICWRHRYLNEFLKQRTKYSIVYSVKVSYRRQHSKTDIPWYGLGKIMINRCVCFLLIHHMDDVFTVWLFFNHVCLDQVPYLFWRCFSTVEASPSHKGHVEAYNLKRG